MTNIASVQSWGSPLAPLDASLGPIGIILLVVLIAAVLVLKGYALWNAAKRDEKWWFIVMLVVNTIGILELIYLAFIVKKWSKTA